ncbi:MAG: transglutaminase-like domain-containing protein [Candidatus Hydrogenedentes bacterium]|nr:transglutaminase-like domain-containing protein [Candidatus Hydrogenedentota bacterium]
MLRRKNLIGVCIVLFWALMTALLLQRELLVPRAQPHAPSARKAQDTWMGIYTASSGGSESRIGYLHLTSNPATRDGERGVSYGLAFKLATTILSFPSEIVLDGSAWVTDAAGLSEFEFSVESFGKHAIQVGGVVEDGRLTVEIDTAGERFPISFPVGPDLLVQGSLGATSLNLPALEIGDEVLIDAFDPITMTKGTARIECIGTEVLIYDGEEVLTKILTITLSGMTTKTWVTLDEEVMRVETPVGFALRRISQEEALAELDRGEVTEILDQVAIRPTGLRPFRGANRMRFRLDRLPESAEIPSGTIQKHLHDGEYLIDVPGPPEGPVELGEGSAHAPFLAGDPFIQVDNERIVAHTLGVVGAAEDPWEKSRRIYDWVYANIRKMPVLSFPSALDVLESREGDCNEHTVLFAAMARTAGVPTRIAIGVVWSEELNGFYYHAWPEVFVGHWVPMDPTLGQEIADATHIKLLEGSIESWPKLTPYLGQLQVEILEVE